MSAQSFLRRPDATIRPPAKADTMIRFSIAPTAQGAWLWRTFDPSNGQLHAQGLASTRKQAAALVIRHIVRACCDDARSQSTPLSAKAA